MNLQSRMYRIFLIRMCKELICKHKAGGVCIEYTKEERVHDYEACDRVCPVLDCRRADTLTDPAEYFH